MKSHSKKACIIISIYLCMEQGGGRFWRVPFPPPPHRRGCHGYPIPLYIWKWSSLERRKLT